MARHFQDQFVKWAYRVETRTNQDASRQDLIDFDETLNRRFDRHLDEEMEAAGIEVTRRNKSIIAMLALSSSGGRRNQVKRACEFWRHVKDMTL